MGKQIPNDDIPDEIDFSKLPDAIIAATALTSSLKLMTRNRTDFECIAGLTIVNPFMNHA